MDGAGWAWLLPGAGFTVVQPRLAVRPAAQPQQQRGRAPAPRTAKCTLGQAPLAARRMRELPSAATLRCHQLLHSLVNIIRFKLLLGRREQVGAKLPARCHAKQRRLGQGGGGRGAGCPREMMAKGVGADESRIAMHPIRWASLRLPSRSAPPRLHATAGSGSHLRAPLQPAAGGGLHAAAVADYDAAAAAPRHDALQHAGRKTAPHRVRPVGAAGRDARAGGVWQAASRQRRRSPAVQQSWAGI